MEHILCAANWYNDGIKHIHMPTNVNKGFVICGRRHHNCITIFAMMAKFEENNGYTPEWKRIHNTEIQGFITNTNRFVGRKEAYTIAYKANQIIGPNKGYPDNNIGLTSEDLY